jgi:hypothetical protein
MKVFFSEYNNGTWISTGSFICNEGHGLWDTIGEKLKKLPMVIVHKGDRTTIYSLQPRTEICMGLRYNLEKWV